MTSGGARARQADRRRTELVDAALKLFAEQGFRGTTIADIAAATGTAHGLVYHYFRSKDELLEEILDRYSFLPQLQSLLAVSPERPAAEVLAEVAVGFSQVLDKRPELLRLVVTESQTNRVVAAALARVSEEGLVAMTEYLRARIAAGELRVHDPTIPARALLWAIITKHLGPPSADGFETDLVAVLLDGIRAN
jgi:AcrR family transcriptional regulator